MTTLFVLGDRNAFSLILDQMVEEDRLSLNDREYIKQCVSYCDKDIHKFVRPKADEFVLWVNCDTKHELEVERREMTTLLGPASNIQVSVKSILEYRL